MKTLKICSITITALLLGLISLLLYQWREQKNNRELLAKYKTEKEYFFQRSELTDYEKALKVKSIGKKLAINYASIKHISSNNILSFRKKILVIAGPEFSSNSNIKMLKIYSKKYQGKIAIIISSPDPSFVKKLFINLSGSVPIFVDSEMQFSQQLELAENETVVLLRNSVGIILYSYIVENENPMKDAEQSEIILNYLNSIK